MKMKKRSGKEISNLIDFCFVFCFRNGSTGQPAGNDGSGWSRTAVEYAAADTSPSGTAAETDAAAAAAEHDGRAAVLASAPATVLNRKWDGEGRVEKRLMRKRHVLYCMKKLLYRIMCTWIRILVRI